MARDPRRRTAVAAGEEHGRRASGVGGGEPTADVLGRAAGGDAHDDVPWAGVGLDLPGEDVRESVVVRQRRQRRRVTGERKRWERAALAPHPANELGSQVLRVGGATTVPERQDAAVTRERLDEDARHGLDGGQQRAHGRSDIAVLVEPAAKTVVHPRTGILIG